MKSFFKNVHISVRRSNLLTFLTTPTKERKQYSTDLEK